MANFMSTRPSTTLADLFTLLFAANPFSAARAWLRRWSSDELEDGLAHGGQCRSRRRPVDSFFPALLFLSRRQNRVDSDIFCSASGLHWQPALDAITGLQRLF